MTNKWSVLRIPVLIVFILIACSCSPKAPPATSTEFNQLALNQIAENLKITYTVKNNHRDANCLEDRAGGKCFLAKISLSSTQAIKHRHWKVYFSHTAPVQSFDSKEFDVIHINGDLHQISPNENYQPFTAGQTKDLNIRADNWHLSEYDPIPNYYITADNLQPRIIESTRPTLNKETKLEQLTFVTTFKKSDKLFKRSPKEQTQWANTQYLFNTTSSFNTDQTQLEHSIIPAPYRMEVDPEGKKLDLKKGLHIHSNSISQSDIDAAVARLNSLGIKTQATGIVTNIQLQKNSNKPAGSYQLDISSENISIVSVDAAGASNALYSIASLIQPGNSSIPTMKIDDQPRYGFRGVLLDVARNFHSKQLILKLLDQMAAYKLNKLHLHLADDEGWRLEIPGLPELTGVASKRCHDLSETRCLIPQLGSGPSENTPVNGYYSVQDYQDILRAAKARHIQVIPSLDMPGHSRAAIKAMEVRYKRLIQKGEITQAMQYRLSDPKDTTTYRSIQFYNDNTLNVCMESTFDFIQKVISEVKKIHDTSDHPLSRYHIGADETAGAWKNSPKCQAFLQNNNVGISTVEQLGPYFIERVSQLLFSMNIEPGGWSDGISQTQQSNMPPVVQANAWGTLFWNGHKEAYELAARGWDVVLSTPDVSYFDFPYEADPKERGYYWGSRHTNSRKVFEFMPDNLPSHAEIWRDREENTMELTATAHEFPLHFHGLQAQLWSETTRTDSQVEYLFFPRLLALAERAWHKPAWELSYPSVQTTYNKNSNFFTKDKKHLREKDWQRFSSALGYKELRKLDLANIQYRVPTVGAIIKNGQLNARTLIPGLPIEYRENQGHWKPYTSPVTVSGTIEIRARSANGKRAGRSLVVEPDTM